jgi:NhaP-type Na+/H+ or K+/H+ antiporter
VSALITGAVTGPGLANFVDPLQWVGGDAARLNTVTLNFTRIVLSIQVMLAGVQLPAKFTKRSRRSLSAILGPGMVGMWITSSFLVWAICVLPGGRRMPFLHALAVGACLAPTDPVLAVTVVRGRFADLHIPPRLSQLISAESGANDGLGYPFLFLALYLIKYIGGTGQLAGSGGGGASKAMEMFFSENIGFVVLLSVAWGVVTGYLARKALQYGHMLGCVDRESLFAFSLLCAVGIYSSSPRT